MSNTTEQLTGEDEELILQCIEVFRVEQKASVVLLQRRLRLGYTRAARIVDEIERRGHIGPARGAEPREVFMEPVPAATKPVEKMPAVAHREYEETAVSQRRAALAVELAGIAEDFAACQAAWQAKGESTLVLVNRMRSAGQRFNRCAGPNHQQLNFTDAGRVFFREQLAPSLPPEITPKFARACCRLARLMPDEAKTPAEALKWEKYIQEAFAFYQGTRGPEHLAPPSDAFTNWLVLVKRTVSETENLLKQADIDQLAPLQLDAILKNAAPVADLYARVKAKRLGLEA